MAMAPSETHRSVRTRARSHDNRQVHGNRNRFLGLLGMEPTETSELLKKIESGLTYRELEHLQRTIALPMERIAELLRIKPRTLIRRREEGRLLPGESDRLVQVSRIIGRALDLFDDDLESARQWLLTPQPALGGEVPLSLVKTETGSREVEDLIGRLELGVFS